MRKCVKCKIDKHLNEFYNNKNRPKGKDYKCKECTKKQRLENKDYFKGKLKEYQKNHSDDLKQYYKQRYKNNKDYYSNYSKQPHTKNKRKQYNQKPYVRLRDSLSTRMYESIVCGKTKNTIELLGESIDFIRGYLQSSFKPEMNWDNYGTIWEIDHIRPCSSFDLTDIEQQKQCFHYSNLQPLFKTTDIAKSFGYDEVGNRNKKNTWNP